MAAKTQSIPSVSPSSIDPDLATDRTYREAAEKVARLKTTIETIIRGKSDVIEHCLIGLLARGHLLIEDIPGVGKSTLSQALAHSLGLTFQRIQFTSDMLPSDILGLMIFDDVRKEFQFRAGPIFSNIILADEINRATPKTQSALLEAMNDRQVTLENKTFPLPQNFMVLATQNPAEHRGTFPLPESQLDRFMLRVHMGYPSFESEREILRNQSERGKRLAELPKVLSAEELLFLQKIAESVTMSEPVETYLLSIVEATRKSDALALGASTRGALALSSAAKARALLFGRHYALPDDVKSLAVPVLAHRVMPELRTGGASRRLEDTEDILSDIVGRIAVPLHK